MVAAGHGQWNESPNWTDRICWNLIFINCTKKARALGVGKSQNCPQMQENRTCCALSTKMRLSGILIPCNNNRVKCIFSNQTEKELCVVAESWFNYRTTGRTSSCKEQHHLSLIWLAHNARWWKSLPSEGIVIQWGKLVQWFSSRAAASLSQRPGSILTLGAVSVAFACFPCDGMGLLQMLWFLPYPRHAG